MTHTAPPVEGLAHITLPVHDLEAAERFYVALLGAKLVRKFDRETFLRVRPGRAHEADADNSPLHLSVQFGHAVELDLFLQKGRSRPVPVPHPHLAMQVRPGDLDTCIARLQQAGVKIDGPRRLGPPGHASVYFSDPFGNLLEFVTLGYQGPVMDGPPDVSQL
ncbi:VOC family protein [Hyalangium minutum]|uniref:VOC domain-containing protein n=1 Tax=Hyalangium minutum TaxID=394096 RepID=A0A085W4T3_9BACT|nr:VOC family protein [Hyalangium minutum]KFE62696.1 hypothetical protein DB31_3810 [Hyalangium minutum]